MQRQRPLHPARGTWHPWPEMQNWITNLLKFSAFKQVRKMFIICLRHLTLASLLLYFTIAKPCADLEPIPFHSTAQSSTEVCIGQGRGSGAQRCTSQPMAPVGPGGSGGEMVPKSKVRALPCKVQTFTMLCPLDEALAIDVTINSQISEIGKWK